MNDPSDIIVERNGGLYLAWSITVTVLSLFVICLNCLSILALPAGIVGIVFSAKINGEIDRGNPEGARRAASQAKLWNWIATGILIAMIVMSVLLFAFWGGASLAEYQQYIERLKSDISAADQAAAVSRKKLQADPQATP